MPGAFGPILTTGMALSAAVVVVVNPVTAPKADVRIPAAQAQISTSDGRALDMLDEEFINAVGPGPAGSTHPLAVLTDLVSALVGNVADIGKDAILRAFVAGASVVSGQPVPELTAVTYPYVVPPTPGSAAVLPWPALPGSVTHDPLVQQALTAIIADSGDIADAGAIAAAFVAGAALAAGEGPILTTLRGLVDSQLRPAVEKVGSVIAELPHPVIGDVIGQTVAQYLPTVPPVEFRFLRARGENPGTGLPAGGAPVVDDESVPVGKGQAREILAEPAGPRFSGADGADSPVDATAPKRPFAGLGSLGLTGIGGPDRTAGGAVGRALKTYADRKRN